MLTMPNHGYIFEKSLVHAEPMLKKEIKPMLYAHELRGAVLWKTRGKPVEKTPFIFIAAILLLTAVLPSLRSRRLDRAASTA